MSETSRTERTTCPSSIRACAGPADRKSEPLFFPRRRKPPASFFFSIEARWSCAAVMSCGAFATSTRGVKGGEKEKKDVAAPAAAATTAAPCVRECQLVVRVDARADVSVPTCALFVSCFFQHRLIWIYKKKKEV